MSETKSFSPIDMATFRFGAIAPVIQGTYPDPSEAAYCRRICEKPIHCPDGTDYTFSPRTLERWIGLYRKYGMDGLLPSNRKDKGISKKITEDAAAEIYRLKCEYPHANATVIHDVLVRNGFITASTSVRAVQRFIKANDLKSARNPSVRDRKAFEMAYFGELWQADTAYLPYITDENGRSRRTYLVMIIDDHSRMIVGGEIFYNDNAYNYQKVLKNAIMTYGLPDKVYMDNGKPYRNDQLKLILGSLGVVGSHTAVRDGASKGKVERNFRTLRSRWLATLDTKSIHSLEQFNALLRNYIRLHNTTVHSTTGETPMDRFSKTHDHIRIPKSQEWLDECFMNRQMRKVNNDACISINSILYDVPPQFIGMNVEVRFLPVRMDDAYILYEGNHFPIHKTNRVDNAHTRRNRNISYTAQGGVSDVF